MMTINTDYSAAYDESDRVYTTYSRTRLTDKIGRDLRGVYDEMTVASQPDYLVELANRVDARRSSEGLDG